MQQMLSGTCRTILGLTVSVIVAGALPAAAQDLRFKTIYTADANRTETVTYIKGARERFDLADMVLLKQRDLKRTIQVSRAAGTYLVIPDGQQAPAMPVPGDARPQAPGVAIVTTTIVDTGERKPAFGFQARRVRTTLDRQPMPGACDTSKQRIETDGWYIDLPASQPPQEPAPPPAGGCVDQVKTTINGDPKALGFPIAYAMTMTGPDGAPGATSMEVTELEVTALDAALFEVPPGMAAAGDIGALARAVSNASEQQLAKEIATTPGVPKAPGVIRIAVPELLNKTTQQVDTRALRAQLIAQLQDARLEAEPLPAGAQPDLLQQASGRGADYLLVAEVTELKVSKPGGFGGLMKAASAMAGGGAAATATEATIAFTLVQPDGKARLSTNGKGKDGGFDMKAGLGVAKFAGSMYMNVMSGRMMLGLVKGGMAGNLQGLGMLGNPAMFNMQAQGLGFPAGSGTGAGMRMGLDPAAGAASFLMQQSLAGAAAAAPGQSGPSFDAALGEAMKNAVRAVTENLKKR